MNERQSRHQRRATRAARRAANTAARSERRHAWRAWSAEVRLNQRPLSLLHHPIIRAVAFAAFNAGWEISQRRAR